MNPTLDYLKTETVPHSLSGSISLVGGDSYVLEGNKAGGEVLWVDRRLQSFIHHEVLPQSGVDAENFWQGFASIVADFTAENRALLEQRQRFQEKIDAWHLRHPGDTANLKAYRQFLQEIGYLEPDVEDFSINTQRCDEEVTLQAGPQLVVPLKNARFTLNATNARWGSLYDALYGTDVIADDGRLARGSEYNTQRGERVIAMGRDFLDAHLPLAYGSHYDVVAYRIEAQQLIITLIDGSEVALVQPEKFLGYQGDTASPSAILFSNNQLRFELLIDKNNPIGDTDKAGICDIVLESALTAIADGEDSVAAVDAEDKLQVYRNWFGLMKGTLSTSFTKVGADGIQHQRERTLNHDRLYCAPDGSPLHIPGRALLFIRNVGHLMTTPAMLDKNGDEVFEGIVDAAITSLIALHDIRGNSPHKNSRNGNIYIVKPKMHGPQEVAFCDRLFARVEALLGLDANTIKMGLMDEERRTSLNLKACIAAAANRIAFINTGFLDRTGDEIHTSMEASPVVPKAQMKTQSWLQAYEKNNVSTGLRCGLQGKAQIGKGMWPQPDAMATMLEEKITHPRAGANTAWVPSPTAATLHVLHYHKVDVVSLQKKMQSRLDLDAELCSEALLEIPLLIDRSSLSSDIIRAEIDNNCQSILGYVVRWIDQGIGCSKVPNIEGVALMEDRATLRISSQHLANWLHHGVCTKQDVEEALLRMAAVVDAQNKHDAYYQSMLPDVQNSTAFCAAADLIFLGRTQPNGYTEPLLHEYRQKKKQQIKLR